MLITMVQIPASYLIPSRRYQAKYLAGYSVYPLSKERRCINAFEAWYCAVSLVGLRGNGLVSSMKRTDFVPSGLPMRSMMSWC